MRMVVIDGERIPFINIFKRWVWRGDTEWLACHSDEATMTITVNIDRQWAEWSAHSSKSLKDIIQTNVLFAWTASKLMAILMSTPMGVGVLLEVRADDVVLPPFIFEWDEYCSANLEYQQGEIQLSHKEVIRIWTKNSLHWERKFWVLHSPFHGHNLVRRVCWKGVSTG